MPKKKRTKKAKPQPKSIRLKPKEERHLSDVSWREIRDAAGLPTDARSAIENALDQFWLAYEDQIIRSDMAQKLKGAIKHSQGLLDELAELDTIEDLEKAGATKDDIKQLDAIGKTCDAIHICIGVLEDVSDRLNKGRGRPSFGPLQSLLAEADLIRQRYTGRRVTNSSKEMAPKLVSPVEYVQVVYKAAVGHVSKSTISDHIERSSRPS